MTTEAPVEVDRSRHSYGLVLNEDLSWEEMIRSGPFRNPMRIHCATELEDFETPIGTFRVTNNLIRPQFEWIKDPETVCCEYIHGINVLVTTVHSPEGVIPVSARTRRAPINSFLRGKLAVAISGAHKRGWFPEPGQYYGTIPSGELTVFVPRDVCRRKAEFSTWHRGPKPGAGQHRIADASIWLYEDLHRIVDTDLLQLESLRSEFHPRLGGRYKKKHARPDGLMFCHPDGMIARIPCTVFRWRLAELLRERAPITGQSKKHMRSMRDDLDQLVTGLLKGCHELRKARAEELETVISGQESEVISYDSDRSG